MYAGLRVLVVGTKASGSDLAREIASHCPATTVHVSDRSLPASHSSTTTASANLHHHPAIQMLTPTGVVFTNAPTPIPIDAILYCTGYAYSFPFLTAPTHVSPSGRHVRPLFKHLFSIPDASLAFLGLPYTVIPFPLMEMQAQWIAAVWLGEAPLPSREEQEAWLAADLSAKAAADSGRDGDNDTRYHFLGPAQWALYEEMICEAGVDVERRSRYVRFLREVWEHVGKTRPTVPGAVDAYRDNVYTVDWDTLEWTVSGPHETLESAVTE
ncbi:hypothetical protein BC830DRAFT_1149610 [Chytriomyces sp. MP71]|nr:hypothetical protein BC830DRAFT_1149610 [Chytriomyces sp. MP71]